MRYNYIDIWKAKNNANELLEQQGSHNRFETNDNFNNITATVEDQHTKEVNIVFENLSRDEAYYWFAGFNAGLMNKVIL